MDVAFLQPRAGDADELAVLAHLLDRGAAGIAHGRAQPPHKLVDHRIGGTLVGHLPLDPFGNQLVGRGILLEVTVRAAPRHGTQGSHAAIGFEAAALVQDHLARRLVGACDGAADHGAACARSDGLGEIAGKLDAAIRDDRHVACSGCRVHDCRQLRHAHARDDPRGADRPRPDAHLDRIGARVDQGAGGLGRGDIAGDHLHLVGKHLDALDRLGDACRMAVGGVDHDHVHARLDQGLAAFKPLVADGRGRSYAQAAQVVLAGQRIQDRLLGILQGQQARQLAMTIGDQQLFDPPFLHQPDGLLAVCGFTQDRQVVRGHHRPHRRPFVAGKAHVTVRDNPHHAALVVHHRKAGDVEAFLERLGVAHGLVGPQRDRVIHDSRFEPLDAPNLVGLLFGGQVAMDHAHAACLRHGDGHAAFGDGVHGGGQQRDVHGDASGHARRHIGGRGHDRGCGRHQKNIIKGKRLTNLHGSVLAATSFGSFPFHASGSLSSTLAQIYCANSRGADNRKLPQCHGLHTHSERTPRHIAPLIDS